MSYELLTGLWFLLGISAIAATARDETARVLRAAIAVCGTSHKTLALDLGLDFGQFSRQLATGQLLTYYRAFPHPLRTAITSAFARADGIVTARDVFEALVGLIKPVQMRLDFDAASTAPAGAITEEVSWIDGGASDRRRGGSSAAWPQR